MIQRVFIALLAGAMLLLSACRQSESSDPPEVYPVVDVDISADDSGIQASPSGLDRPLVFTGSFTNVTTVTVTATGEDKFGVPHVTIPGDVLATVNLTKAASVWSGTIAGLAVGPNLTFTANGYTAASALIFSGAVSQVLTGVSDSVKAAMSPVDNGAPFNFPVVTSLPLPATLLRSTSVAIPIGVTGSPNETLTFAITPATGGTFVPRTGSLALPASGTGTINTTYTAPGTTGTKTHTLTVTNSQSNAVAVTFRIVVN